jgi:hypothetical protein
MVGERAVWAEDVGHNEWSYQEYNGRIRVLYNKCAFNSMTRIGETSMSQTFAIYCQSQQVYHKCDNNYQQKVQVQCLDITVSRDGARNYLPRLVVEMTSPRDALRYLTG